MIPNSGGWPKYGESLTEIKFNTVNVHCWYFLLCISLQNIMLFLQTKF